MFSLSPHDPATAFEEKIKTDYIQGGVSFLDKAGFTFKVLKFIKKNKIEGSIYPDPGITLDNNSNALIENNYITNRGYCMRGR